MGLGLGLGLGRQLRDVAEDGLGGVVLRAGHATVVPERLGLGLGLGFRARVRVRVVQT